MKIPTPKSLFVLGGIAAVIYLLSGLFVGFSPSHWEEAATADQVIWIVLSLGGCFLLTVGLWLFQRSPWTGAALISLGGVLGALPLFWTVLLPLLAIALVVLSFIHARRETAANPA